MRWVERKLLSCLVETFKEGRSGDAFDRAWSDLSFAIEKQDEDWTCSFFAAERGTQEDDEEEEEEEGD